MSNINAAVILLLMLIVTKPAIAVDVQTWEELKKTSRDILEIRIEGVGAGYSWSNSILENRGSAPLYCPPGKIALNADNYIAIIDAQLAKFKKFSEPDFPLDLILYFGLVDSFPCSE